MINLSHPFATLLLAAIGFAIVLMVIVWRVALRVNNLGIVDVAWSFGFLPLVLGFAYLAPGDPVRRAMVATSFRS